MQYYTVLGESRAGKTRNTDG